MNQFYIMMKNDENKNKNESVVRSIFSFVSTLFSSDKLVRNRSGIFLGIKTII